MGFWGIEVKPGKPYSYHSDDVEGKVYVTQATLGHGSSAEKSILQCSVRNGSSVYLCSLLPNKVECCPLDLEFEEEDNVVFSVIGARSIHLSGNFIVDDGDSGEELYDSDSLGEDIAGTDSGDSDELSNVEEESEDDFSEDIDMLPSSSAPNSGVVIEEIVDDDEPAHGKCQSKQPKKKNQDGDSENKNSQGQIALKRSRGVPVLESEDEDGFPISSSHKSEVTLQHPNKGTAEKTKIKKTKDVEECGASTKRKVDNIDQDGQLEREKRKKKKQQKELNVEGKAHEDGELPEVAKENPCLVSHPGNEHGQKPVNENEIHSEEEKKKKKKKKKTQEGEGLNSKEKIVSATADNGVLTAKVEKQTEAKPSKARTFGNGFVIEDLAMGKPDGKRASPGMNVSVNYIGKLQKNGEMFDSNVGKEPFKFRLGVGGVIKGWDVGINGMRIGDKRRLTIPPSMGYGAKGAGGKIPPNSWLVFDVELVDVKR